MASDLIAPDCSRCLFVLRLSATDLPGCHLYCVAFFFSTKLGLP